MPLFEYVCQSCRKPFEVLLKSSAGKPSGCPACGSKRVARQLSTFAAVAAAPSAAPACASGACPSGACGSAAGGCAGGSCPWN